jgi:hypothetical protein
MTRFAAVALLGLVLCGVAQAFWAVGNTASGAAKARTMPAGNVPSGTVAGSSVTLNWTASNFAGGGAVPGYAVRRFNNVGGAEATVLAACTNVTTNTCTENGVPIGTWRYTITPAAGAWRGTQSAQSGVIAVLI